MKIPSDSNQAFNLVAIGSWNPAILSPQWVKHHLVPEAGQDVLLAIPMQPMALPRLTADGVNIYPGNEQLVFDCVELGDEALRKVGEKFGRICGLLPHTPVSAIGLNFRFQGSVDNEPQLVELFSFSDAANISADTYKLRASSVRRSFVLGDGTLLNLSIDNAGAEFRLEFNFHADVPSMIEAAQKATPELILQRRQQALDFLRMTYEIEIED